MSPDIITAIRDENLFRHYLTDGDLDSWGNWMAMLKALYGLETTEGDRKIIRENTGRDPQQLPSEGFSEGLLLCGRRSGKSKVVALIAAYEAILSGRVEKM